MIKSQFPDDFEKRMRGDLGTSWQAFADAHKEATPVSIRMNPRKLTLKPLGDSIPWTTTGLYLPARPSFTLDPTFHAGCYYVQEASSMFLEQAFIQFVSGEQHLNILDLSAAPGGKSTHILSLINKQSLLVSNEVIRQRAGVLAENVQKWGYDNVVVTNNDPQDFQRLPGFFDVIVVDAPCSGEGLFRKDFNAMNEWSGDNVLLCSKRQRRILSDVLPALRPGGILIYATCTYNANENEDNLEWLSKESDITFLPLEGVEKWGIVPVSKGPVIGYRFYPHRVKGEGFFMAVMRKDGDGAEYRHRQKGSFTGPSKKIMERVRSWVNDPDEKTFIVRNEQLQFFPKGKTSEVEALARCLYIIMAGTNLLTIKHDKLIPEHPAALSTELNRDNFKIVDVELDEALRYLRKETMTIQPIEKGFTLISYLGIPLGWMNVLDTRINNLYPAEWRIRM
ncbi:MAG: rRNA methyltransferase [Chryseolinea sp.]